MTSVLLHDFIIKEHVQNALKEDIGFGDITTDYLIPEDKRITAKLNSREDAILCGIDIVEMVFKTLSNDVKIQKFFSDGDKVKKTLLKKKMSSVFKVLYYTKSFFIRTLHLSLLQIIHLPLYV